MIKMKTRKLYTVRYETTEGHQRHRPVGYKSRLLPRAAAMRVVRRLKKSGVFAYAYPLIINMTPAEVAYMDARYA